MLAASTDDIATLRIEIKYIEPLIWRRVAVRTSMNLKTLHTVIQATTGWLDCHLWEFTIGDSRYSLPDPDRPHVKNAATTRLAAFLGLETSEFLYVYDFGDNWEHRIVVEEISTADADVKYPQFLGGERRCPPEDCGGPPGYFDFIENIAKKGSKEATEALQWYGGPYNPDDIDENQIEIALRRIANRVGRSKAVKKIIPGKRMKG